MIEDEIYPLARRKFVNALRKHFVMRASMFITPEKLDEIFAATLKDVGGAQACIALVEYAEGA